MSAVEDAMNIEQPTENRTLGCSYHEALGKAEKIRISRQFAM
jgi:hypothetical protein